MGFSVASSNSLGHCYLSKNHHQRTGKKFVSFYGNFKLSKLFIRAQSRRLFCCKIEAEGVDFQERTSAAEVKKEIEQCYKLIQRLGRGVVYLGSSRLGPNHPHYAEAFELGKEIASLLDCTSWSGAGPGLMDAVTKGALQAGKPVGGFKIAKEAGEWTATNFHPYLPLDCYLTCRFFSARKHGLVDAAVRATGSDRTAVVALPGGIGTLDEAFEILALIQLERIGSMLPVPFLLMNYDSFYSKLLDFLDDCEVLGTLSKGELASLWKVCNNNSEALAYLAEYYSLSGLTNDYKTVTK
ncbi:putative lysine decarboxylase family protein [Abeliophyllum distichum]|uniref:Lysine decarboxylase family protein n=1 Tax=Abeliophyllum distichum TaxID=126358 RepID=A0ABD1QJS5_9LAMI